MRVLVLILIGIIASLFPHTIRAVGEFKADYDVGYSIAPNGTSIVTQVITLTNQYTNLSLLSTAVK